MAITFISSNGTTAINFIVSIIIARLLSPSEIGIFSISAVLIGVAHIFRDFGVGSYLVREKELTPGKIRSASGVLYLTSWLTALLLYIVSSYAADYYETPAVKDVIHVLALGFVFIPFGAVTSALLSRELRAKEQAIANLVGITVFATSSILMAYHGFSYMTMAWANLLNIIATGLAYLPFRPKHAPWLPSFRGWREVVSFGSGVILGNSINAANFAISDVVLGKISSTHAVGIFSRAQSTANIFNQIISPTMFYAVLPLLSKRHHDGLSLHPPLAAGLPLASSMIWPAYTFIALFANEIVLFLYGEKWLECTPIVQIISVTAILTLPTMFNNHAVIAIGRPYISAITGITAIFFKLAIIWLLFDGTLESFAYAILIAALLNYPVQLWIMFGFLGFDFKKLFLPLTDSFKISILLAILMFLLKTALTGYHPALQLLIASIAASIVWIFLIRTFKHVALFELNKVAQRFPLLRPLIGPVPAKNDLP